MAYATYAHRYGPAVSATRPSLVGGGQGLPRGFDTQRVRHPEALHGRFTWGKSPLNKKKLRYAIIDGKQRLEAIFDFYDGLVVLNDDFKLLSAPKLSLGGLGYKDLIDQYPRVADVFDQYNLLVMGVVANSEERINELFVRLNRSKPLTGAEIRNAMAGPAPSVIRQISRHEFFKDNIGFAASRGRTRMPRPNSCCSSTMMHSRRPRN